MFSPLFSIPLYPPLSHTHTHTRARIHTQTQSHTSILFSLCICLNVRCSEKEKWADWEMSSGVKRRAGRVNDSLPACQSSSHWLLWQPCAAPHQRWRSPCVTPPPGLRFSSLLPNFALFSDSFRTEQTVLTHALPTPDMQMCRPPCGVTGNCALTFRMASSPSPEKSS